MSAQMTRLTRDPELERLVQELNGAAPPAEGERRASFPAATLAEGNPLATYLMEMSQRGASDLLLIANAPPTFRVAGRLIRSGDPLSADDTESLLGDFMTPAIRERLLQDGAADFSVRLGSSEQPMAEAAATSAAGRRRYRINLHRQRGTLAAAIRALPEEIPTLDSLRLPPTLADLVKPRRGLILVSGPTGSGKSTTLAALVGEINRNEGRHIITIEDPIEYEHRNVQSTIEQVEIGRDAPSFASALRAGLRQDPDVILVGEMRDLETVATALTAAETGHLILSTLHTSDAAQAIHRIVDVFPANQQTQIRQQLALSLNAIITQHLIPATAGGVVVAVEVLLANHAVRNHIRQDRVQNFASELTLGKRQGMISLEDSLSRLVQSGFISLDEARSRTGRPDELDSLLKR